MNSGKVLRRSAYGYVEALMRRRAQSIPQCKCNTLDQNIPVRSRQLNINISNILSHIPQ